MPERDTISATAIRRFDEAPEIVAPRDIDFPGTITLHVDARDIDRRIFQVTQTIPVAQAGPMTLFYPKWLPGYHSPRSPIELFAGLEITAGGVKLAWRRDPVEVYAFHILVPQGADALELRFQFLSPTAESQGDVMVTPQMLNLHWNTVVLYPAGHFARRIVVEPAVTLPQGWTLACALEQARTEGQTTTFKPAALDVVVDSPLFAGRHFRAIDLEDGGRVRLNLFGDRADLIDAGEDEIAPHRALIAEADALFGERHYDHYDFLTAVSDQLGGGGVERRRSSEIVVPADYFTRWSDNEPKRDVFAHEYVHSWNGKFLRGADSWTPSFECPIRNSLMWVYEGQTQYWGQVLAARSGLWSPDMALQALGRTAAVYAIRKGGVWRPMSDTTRDPIIVGRSPLPWVSWQRSEDYYSEGQLMWLDVDTRIRQLTDDNRSLDDFARTFFGEGESGDETRTYRFADVVSTLNNIAAWDWETLLIDHLETREPGTNLDSLERGGYRLVYRDTPSTFAAAEDAVLGTICLRFSVGLTLGSSGSIEEVIWDSPAFEAGLTAGAEIIAVNGLAYSTQMMLQAIRDAQDGGPIALEVKRAGEVHQVSVNYSGGPRYPHLEPIEGARRRLDEIYAPRAKA